MGEMRQGRDGCGQQWVRGHGETGKQGAIRACTDACGEAQGMSEATAEATTRVDLGLEGAARRAYGLVGLQEVPGEHREH